MSQDATVKKLVEEALRLEDTALKTLGKTLSDELARRTAVSKGLDVGEDLQFDTLIRMIRERTGLGETDAIAMIRARTQESAAPAESAAVRIVNTDIEKMIDIARKIALGTLKSNDTPIRLKGAWRNVDSDGNGGEMSVRVMRPGQLWRFVSQFLPVWTSYGAREGVVTYGDVYTGDLVVNYSQQLHHGRPCRKATQQGNVGLVIGPQVTCGDNAILWKYATPEHGMMRIPFLSLTIPSPDWQ